MEQRDFPGADDIGGNCVGFGSRLAVSPVRRTQAEATALDSLYALGRKIRSAENESDLSEIENQIDEVLRAQRARASAEEEDALDAATLNVAAHRLENLIHDRRAALAAAKSKTPA